MKRQYNGWVSEYRRKKFIERQKLKKEKKLLKSMQKVNSSNSKTSASVILDLDGISDDIDDKKTELNSSNLEPSIAIMLDLDGTSDGINDKKAENFISQLDTIRKMFEAKIAFISISTHYNSSYEMKRVLNILSRHLCSNTKIGISFYYGGTYDFDKDEEKERGFSFNSDKVETFDSYFVNSIKTENKWFAIIDDRVEDEIFIRYQDRHPMLVALPSQDKRRMSKNNFMRIATTTSGFDGVIEILDLYIKSIKDLTTKQILEKQKNMITHLSSDELMNKIMRKDFMYLIRYFKEGYADEADYEDALWMLYHNLAPTKEEMEYLKIILEALQKHFEEKKEEQLIDRALKLQRLLEASCK